MHEVTHVCDAGGIQSRAGTAAAGFFEVRCRACAPSAAACVDRLLARVTRVLGKAAMLKGGLVLELRLESGRETVSRPSRPLTSALSLPKSLPLQVCG